MVGVGGWCAPKARARKDGLPKEMACRGIGVSQKQGMRLQRKKSSRMGTKSLLREKSNNMEVRCEGVEGATAKPPPRLRRGEIPCLRAKVTMSERTDAWSRPSGATICKWWVKQLGGASADAQSYWQGRFAACALVGDFLWSGRPRKSWGVAPNPTRELRPLTPQGGFPLDPFLAPRLERFSLTVPSSTL